MLFAALFDFFSQLFFSATCLVQEWFASQLHVLIFIWFFELTRFVFNAWLLVRTESHLQFVSTKRVEKIANKYLDGCAWHRLARSLTSRLFSLTCGNMLLIILVDTINVFSLQLLRIHITYFLFQQYFLTNAINVFWFTLAYFELSYLLVNFKNPFHSPLMLQH